MYKELECKVDVQLNYIICLLLSQYDYSSILTQYDYSPMVWTHIKSQPFRWPRPEKVALIIGYHTHKLT
jgi:hypothetical protein